MDIASFAAVEAALRSSSSSAYRSWIDSRCEATVSRRRWHSFSIWTLALEERERSRASRGSLLENSSCLWEEQSSHPQSQHVSVSIK